MWKRILSILFILMAVIIVPSLAFASEGDDAKYEVILPKEEDSTYKNKVILVSGKAPEGTIITIELYGVVDLTGNKYSLANLPDEDDYTLISTVDVESGALGFAEEIELIRGINKIIINFNVEEVISVERIVYYNDAQQIIENYKNKSTIPSAI